MGSQILQSTLRQICALCRSENADTVEAALFGYEVRDIRVGADESLLHVATIHNDHPDVLRVLLRLGCDVNSRGFRSNARTALHEAARLGKLLHLRVLLQSGARVDCRKSGDWSPLMCAANHDFAECVHELLCHGADVNARNSTGATPLYLAARCGGVNALRVLLHCRDVDISVRTNNGRTPLHAAATAGSVDAVKMLLEVDTSLINKVDLGGMCAAHEASAHGNSDALVLLLNAPNGHGAAQCGDKALLDAMSHAAISGSVDCIKLLLPNVHGVGANHCPAELALINGHVSAFRFLLTHGTVVRESVLSIRNNRNSGYHQCVAIAQQSGQILRDAG